MTPCPSMFLIKRAVAERYDVSVLGLESRRHGGLVLPRHVAMWLCREMTRASYPEIGRAFGNRDHTTVMQACRKIDAALDGDVDLADVVARLKRAVERHDSEEAA